MNKHRLTVIEVIVILAVAGIVISLVVGAVTPSSQPPARKTKSSSVPAAESDRYFRDQRILMRQLDDLVFQVKDLESRLDALEQDR